MQKTAVVAVSYCVWVPKYKVYERRMSRHMVSGVGYRPYTQLPHVHFRSIVMQKLRQRTRQRLAPPGHVMTMPTMMALGPKHACSACVQAHDEAQACNVGDIVRISATRRVACSMPKCHRACCACIIQAPASPRSHGSGWRAQQPMLMRVAPAWKHAKESDAARVV